MADLGGLIAAVEIDVHTSGTDAARRTAADLGAVTDRLLEPPAHLMGIGSLRWLRPENFDVLLAGPRR
ncbi:hypothetical protein [Methylobacterium brachiatum]|uniref:hypothetical protein n=1 Tax=Methylobacterium brachiatum TaxID=269660 RepID=UPI00244A71CD|nr:hypothetical protein [Methylobacterium brachiatum]MDH2313998.1 hypothetical protein [Methylobacterium brachiatum]